MLYLADHPKPNYFNYNIIDIVHSNYLKIALKLLMLIKLAISYKLDLILNLTLLYTHI